MVPSDTLDEAMARFEGFCLDDTTFLVVLKREFCPEKEINKRLGVRVLNFLMPALAFGFQRDELSMELTFGCRLPGETFW